MKLYPDQIAQILGKEPPPKDKPVTPTQHAQAELDALNERVGKHIETQREPGESSEQAAARVYSENPDLYRQHSAMIDDIKAKHGIGGQNLSRPVGQ